MIAPGTTSIAKTSPHEFSVCIGRDCIGRAVEQEPGRWTAFTADDVWLGTYPTRRAATDSIIASAKRV